MNKPLLLILLLAFLVMGACSGSNNPDALDDIEIITPTTVAVVATDE